MDVTKIHGLWFPEEGFQGGTGTSILLQLWAAPFWPINVLGHL